MVNWIGPDIGLKLIDRFDTDYLQNKYHKKQLKVCKELNIQPSKCVIFGITDKNISSLKSAQGLVCGSFLCKTITNSLRMRQNPVTNLVKVVYNLRKKTL